MEWNPDNYDSYACHSRSKVERQESQYTKKKFFFFNIPGGVGGCALLS